MGRLVAIACVTLAGCSTVFRLDPVPDHPDGPPVPPCAAPVGHDEDGDQLDDACDDCPGFADADQTDSDGDLIGDACDPNPMVAGESLVKFLSFSAATDKSDYWMTASPISVNADNLVFAGGTGQFMTYVPAPPSYPFELQTKITLMNVDRSIYNHVQLSGNDGTSAMDLCYYYHVMPADDAWAATPSGAGVKLPVTYASATTFVVRATSTGTALSCRIDGTTSANATFTATSTTPMANRQVGQIAVGVNTSALQMAWFAIYKLP